ncbi:hypothetical protein B9Z47_05435 [Limnohabitans sp. 2KL-1]|nr:hypothetical protein B9Z47_05435 [Limnohabitans sp. 2KL-1]
MSLLRKPKTQFVIASGAQMMLRFKHLHPCGSFQQFTKFGNRFFVMKISFVIPLHKRKNSTKLPT